MTDNTNTPNEVNDKRIIERLAERQRKLDRVAEFSRSSKKGLYTLYTAISIAACLALVVLVAPFGNDGGSNEGLSIERPSFSNFRAALPELQHVETMIDKGEYYNAIDLTEAKLKESDKKIKQMLKKPMFGDEEWEYEFQAESLLNSELRWAFIYLLMMVEDDRTAVKQIKKYLEAEDFCIHRKEAESILRALS